MIAERVGGKPALIAERVGGEPALIAEHVGGEPALIAERGLLYLSNTICMLILIYINVDNIKIHVFR